MKGVASAHDTDNNHPKKWQKAGHVVILPLYSQLLGGLEHVFFPYMGCHPSH
jgi:hypothetical protein